MTHLDLRLLVESTVGSESRRDASELLQVVIGSGVHELDIDTLLSQTHAPRSAQGRRALRFEAALVEGSPALIMITPPELRARVNAMPAARVGVLRVGDQVQVEGATLHVTLHRVGEPRAPSAEELGARCDICLVDVVEDTLIIRHECGALLHAEDESVPIESRLECARLGSCQKCGEPVSLESGLAYLPEI